MADYGTPRDRLIAHDYVPCSGCGVQPVPRKDAESGKRCMVCERGWVPPSATITHGGRTERWHG